MARDTENSEDHENIVKIYIPLNWKNLNEFLDVFDLQQLKKKQIV